MKKDKEKQAIRGVDEARQIDTAMLLGEINKLRNMVCKNHDYEFRLDDDLVDDNRAKFVCKKCSHYVIIDYVELTDEWVKLIVEKNYRFYINYMAGFYKELKKTKEQFQIEDIKKIKENKTC